MGIRILLKMVCIIVLSTHICSAKNSILGNSNANQCRLTTVSIIQLISHPENFEGKCVSVQGVFHVEREGSAIFLDEGSEANHIYANAIRLRLDEDILDKLGDFSMMSQLNGKYYQIDGKFILYNVSGGVVGYIEQIQRISDLYFRAGTGG